MSAEIDNDFLEAEVGLDKTTEATSNIYPNAEVRVEKAQFSILHLKRLCEDREELIIDPDFQRHDVWDRKQGAELVESILMGIPIPIMYLFETKEGKKQVVDGRQRITAILKFLNNKYELKDLRILAELNGKRFSDLDLKMQGIFEDYQLSFYIIQPPTPERVKYDIFDRVNRGGTQLNSQEMRNALYRGKATELIERLSNSEAFKAATAYGVNTKRMKDRYIILRFIAFYLLRTDTFSTVTNITERIEYKSDIDDFLAKVMIFINEEKAPQVIDQCEMVFIQSMENIVSVLGEDAFRFESKQTKRPINMPLFEAMTYLFTFTSATLNPERTRTEVYQLKAQFDKSEMFSGNIDSTTSINYRFEEVESLAKKLQS